MDIVTLLKELVNGLIEAGLIFNYQCLPMAVIFLF